MTGKYNGYSTYTGPDPTGSFMYDNTTDTFSDFDVKWDTVTFDFTSIANSIVQTTLEGSLNTPGTAFFDALTTGTTAAWCAGEQNNVHAQSGCNGSSGFAFYFDTGVDGLNPTVDGLSGPFTGIGENEYGTYTVKTVDVTPAAPSAVPEPSTYGLMMSGVGLMMMMRKRIATGLRQATRTNR